MAELVRIYHPETNEPFDVIPSIADRLRLDENWLSQPFTLVEKEAPKGRGRKRVSAAVEVDTTETDESWRDAPTEDFSEAA